MCMPALGDHAKIEIGKIENPARADMLDIPTSINKIRNMSNLLQKPTKTKHDMFRYGLIHFDMS